jgi:SAM-dependent methyltransferase
LTAVIDRALRRVRFAGISRYCPCCRRHFNRFTPFGNPPREEAECPMCGTLERHRLIWKYLSEKTDLFSPAPKRMLHVAPEGRISRLLREHKQIDYLSADFDPRKAMVQMDIHNIQYPDESFDVIYCSHVLEHVRDDRQAMREFRRVLRTGGWAILQVPMFAQHSHEDPSITDPRDRERLYGQDDHVRAYGPDYADRLREEGFNVTVDGYAYSLSPAEVTRLGIVPENIYVCRRPAGTA